MKQPLRDEDANSVMMCIEQLYDAGLIENLAFLEHLTHLHRIRDAGIEREIRARLGDIGVETNNWYALNRFCEMIGGPNEQLRR